MLVVDILEGELIEEIRRAVKDKGVTSPAVVSLIGAADSFTVSTMPMHDATKDIMTDYAYPAEMTGTGEIIGGEPHLHRAEIRTHFARVYLLPAP